MQAAMATRVHHIHLIFRYLMGLLSGIIFVSGFVLFSLGVWVRYGATAFVLLMGSFSGQMVTISYVCMVVGGGLCLVGFIGMYGAMKENRCLILLYFGIVSAIIVGEVIGTITLFVYKEQVNLMIREVSKKTLLISYVGLASSDPISVAWNRIMTNYKCCGFENSTDDFKNSVFSANTGLLYPKTCCVHMNDLTCDGLNMTLSLLHPQSCIDKVINEIQDQSFFIGCTITTICVMELTSMVLSVVLFVRLSIAFR